MSLVFARDPQAMPISEFRVTESLLGVCADSALYNLVREGRIELEEALSNADSRTNLEAKINFG